VLSHTLSLINVIYKSADKKNKKVNNELIALNFEQIVALYMDECMELPFEVIVEVLDRKPKAVRKLITKSKKLLMSHKEMIDIKEYYTLLCINITAYISCINGVFDFLY